MLSENTLFFVLKNKNKKTVFRYQTYFLVLKNRKLFSKTIVKQAFDLGAGIFFTSRHGRGVRELSIKAYQVPQQWALSIGVITSWIDLVYTQKITISKNALMPPKWKSSERNEIWHTCKKVIWILMLLYHESVDPYFIFLYISLLDRKTFFF